MLARPGESCLAFVHLMEAVKKIRRGFILMPPLESQSQPNVRIVRFHSLGGPEVLQLDELPMPEPKSGEVRLRVKAIGLNRAEVMFRRGRYLQNPELPSKLGYEASGIVEAVGPDVDRAWLGKTVSTVPAFPANVYGVYGEVAIVPATALASYPAKLSFEQGTSIWMQYLTAYGALILHGKIQRGDFVLITAASSSVGIAAMEIVKAEGAISIVTTRTRKKKSELLSLGADHVIVTEEEELAARVHEITAGKGARVIFDPVAGPGIEALAQAASRGGMIIEYGALASEPTPFPLFTALSKSLEIRGYTLFEIVSQPDVFPRAKQYVFDHLEAGSFKPRIDKVFRLDQIVEAHRHMESNAQIGKIVVTV